VDEDEEVAGDDDDFDDDGGHSHSPPLVPRRVSFTPEGSFQDLSLSIDTLAALHGNVDFAAQDALCGDDEIKNGALGEELLEEEGPGWWSDRREHAEAEVGFLS
jgi:hypothetical protein